MKANELVKENGIEKCKRILDDLTDQGHNGDFYKELKRLVESHELVDVEGGIDQVKDTFSFAFKHGADELTEYGKRLKQAIFDVESCQ